MLQPIVLFVTLLLYSIIVSQSFSYIISQRQVQQAMDGEAYLQFRKLTDRLFQQRYRPVMYAGLLSNLALVMVSALSADKWVLISATTAFFALVADAMVTVKGNLPINAIINQWTEETLPTDWQQYRRRWLQVYSIRQVLSIVGYCSLLAAAVFGRL